jgi:uncharacterized protein (TIGR03032 family)
LTHEGDDRVLLISAPRSGAGGLFFMDGLSAVPIDRISTQGLAMRAGQLARVITSGRVATPCSDVLVYDGSGLRRTYRIDGPGNIHDALYLGDMLLLVDTAGNAIRALAQDGTLNTWWQGPALFDAWHLNCLSAEGNHVIATAFGQGSSSSGWREQSTPDGVLIRLPEETVLVRGLAKPHNPRKIDEMWVVCNSAESELLGFDDSGRLQKKCTMGGFTRGLTYDANHVFVGESRVRVRAGEKRWSCVNVLDRTSWKIIDSFEVPVPEIYALALVAPSLVAGAARGYAGDPGSVAATGPLPHLKSSPVGECWAACDLLPAGLRRFTIESDIPDVLPANSHLKVRCRIANHGDAQIDSVGPFPVDVSYRWHGADGQPVRQAIRFELPHEVAPGETCDAELIIATPNRRGAFRLNLLLAQEDVVWSDVFAGEVRSYDVNVVEGSTVSVTEALARPLVDVGNDDVPGQVVLIASDDGAFALVDGHLKMLDPRPTVSLRLDWPYLYRSIVGDSPGSLDLIVYDAFGVAFFRRGEGAPAQGSDWPNEFSDRLAREIVAPGVRGAHPSTVLAGRYVDSSAAEARIGAPIDKTWVRDVAVIPSALLAGLAKGYDTNPTRVREEAYLARFRELRIEPVTLWPFPVALSPSAMAVRIRASVPDRMQAGAETLVSYSAQNVGNAWFVPSKQHRVATSYRWYDADRKQVGRDSTSLRTPLPRTIGPGDTWSAVMRMLAPRLIGRYTVLITLVQELTGWFSDASAASGCLVGVEVIEP